MTNDELKKARKIARQAYEDSLVARPMFDERFDDEEQTLLISLDEELFEAKLRAALPEVRIRRSENGEIIVSLEGGQTNKTTE
jgi:hypothetical protein